MKKILLVMMLCWTAMLNASDVAYTADDVRIFSNPERGFITMLTRHLSEEKPYGVKGKESTLDEHIAKDSISLVLVHYYLDNYRETATLPSKILNAFDEDMQVLRNKGLKAIIRFSYVDGTYYNKKKKEYSAQDAPLEIAQSHIGQYMSHWQNNADVIYVFQAGLIGAWGEWYYTDHYGNQGAEMNESRRALVDTLLAAVPADRCIQLRTPLFKTSYAGDTSPLTATEAYQNTPKARFAHHNDAFLYDYDNMGTYVDTATQKPWLAQETLYVPIGGETDITEADKAQEWATYEKTTEEMSRLHWTFIQSGYAETTTDMWRANGTFDELNRKLGYRYQLENGAFSDEVIAGSPLSVMLQIRNVGYAPLYNARPAYIVLKSDQYSAIHIQLESDPRSWLPNGVVTTIQEQVTIPEEVPAGTYHLYLYLPDAYARLADDPRYAVRFANEDVWDAATGMNDLHAEVKVIDKGELPAGVEMTIGEGLKPYKILEEGILFIVRSDGKKYYCF